MYGIFMHSTLKTFLQILMYLILTVAFEVQIILFLFPIGKETEVK